jgi:NAD-dependent SIR2 family protein deacetylase
MESDMESVRKGLRSQRLTKDTYERLVCAECDEQLDTRDNPDGLGKIRRCPECGTEWKQVG